MKKKSSQSQPKVEAEKSKSEKPENVTSKEVPSSVKDEDILTMPIDQNKAGESKDEATIQKHYIEQQHQHYQQQQQQEHLQQPSILRKAEPKVLENSIETYLEEKQSHSIPETKDLNGKLSSTSETPHDHHHQPELSILIMKNEVADRIVSNYSSGRENHHDHHHMVRKSSMEKHKVYL